MYISILIVVWCENFLMLTVRDRALLVKIYCKWKWFISKYRRVKTWQNVHRQSHISEKWLCVLKIVDHQKCFQDVSTKKFSKQILKLFRLSYTIEQPEHAVLGEYQGHMICHLIQYGESRVKCWTIILTKPFGHENCLKDMEKVT